MCIRVKYSSEIQIRAFKTLHTYKKYQKSQISVADKNQRDTATSKQNSTQLRPNRIRLLSIQCSVPLHLVRLSRLVAQCFVSGGLEPAPVDRITECILPRYNLISKRRH